MLKWDLYLWETICNRSFPLSNLVLVRSIVSDWK